jgi:sugar phosphate isomerase/epimerase
VDFAKREKNSQPAIKEAQALKFGLSTLGCPAWSLERVAEAAIEYGYDGVELRLLDGEIISPSLLQANRGRIIRLFGSGKPGVVGLGTSVRFTSADAEERAALAAELRQFIAIAGELGIPLVRVFGGNVVDVASDEEAVPRVAEGIGSCIVEAERAGVIIALETHDDFSRSAMVARALAEVPSRAAGALWDVHHPYRMGEPVAEVWKNLASRLVHVHLKDARRRADGAWDLVLMGEGEVPCREILRALVMRNYDGFVVAEWEKKWHPKIEEPEIAFPQHLEVMRRWIADLA